MLAPDSSFGPSLSSLGVIKSYSALFSWPDDGCGTIENAASLAGKIAFVFRGSCAFTVKATQIANAGAVAMILVDATGTGVVMGKAPSDPFFSSIPSGCINMNDWNKLKNSFDNGFIQVNAPVPSTPSDAGVNILSSFSSRGPTTDGRFKPDISSVGEHVLSVNSQGYASQPNWCFNPPSSIKSMDGTSMATPITSGSAALIRQYFQDGFYYSGVLV